MAETVTDEIRAGWNPLNCNGTELPARLLMMVKLITVAVFLKGDWSKLPIRHLPMVSALDAVPPDAFQLGLKLAFALAAAALFCNRNVRFCCLILGCVLILAMLGARDHYRNSKVFTACIFLLTGLQKPGGTPWLYTAQFALMYFGSGLNKLLEPDWRNGQYFEHWTTDILQHRAATYRIVADFLPEGWLSFLMGWMTIGVELVILPLLLLIPRLRGPAIWVGLLFHAGALFMTRQEFGIFYSVLLIAYLSLTTWPTQVRLHYNESLRTGRLFAWCARALDTNRMLTVSPGGNRFLILETDRGNQFNYRAMQRASALLPPLYLIGVILLAAPGVDSLGKYFITAAGAFLFFPPVALAANRFLLRSKPSGQRASSP